MLETIIVAGVVGFVSAMCGAIIGQVVQGERLKNLIERITKVESHLDRVIHSDTCNNCKEGSNSKHDEVIRRITALEKSFRECFDNLVTALRKEG